MASGIQDATLSEPPDCYTESHPPCMRSHFSVLGQPFPRYGSLSTAYQSAIAEPRVMCHVPPDQYVIAFRPGSHARARSMVVDVGGIRTRIDRLLQHPGCTRRANQTVRRLMGQRAWTGQNLCAVLHQHCTHPHDVFVQVPLVHIKNCIYRLPRKWFANKTFVFGRDTRPLVLEAILESVVLDYAGVMEHAVDHQLAFPTYHDVVHIRLRLAQWFALFGPGADDPHRQVVQRCIDRLDSEVGAVAHELIVSHGHCVPARNAALVARLATENFCIVQAVPDLYGAVHDPPEPLVVCRIARVGPHNVGWLARDARGGDDCMVVVHDEPMRSQIRAAIEECAPHSMLGEPVDCPIQLYHSIFVELVHDKRYVDFGIAALEEFCQALCATTSTAQRVSAFVDGVMQRMALILINGYERDHKLRPPLTHLYVHSDFTAARLALDTWLGLLLHYTAIETFDTALHAMMSRVNLAQLQQTANKPHEPPAILVPAPARDPLGVLKYLEHDPASDWFMSSSRVLQLLKVVPGLGTSGAIKMYLCGTLGVGFVRSKHHNGYRGVRVAD